MRSIHFVSMASRVVHGWSLFRGVCLSYLTWDLMRMLIILYACQYLPLPMWCRFKDTWEPMELWSVFVGSSILESNVYRVVDQSEWESHGRPTDHSHRTETQRIPKYPIADGCKMIHQTAQNARCSAHARSPPKRSRYRAV